MDDDHGKETGEPVDFHDSTHQTLSETVPRFCIDWLSMHADLLGSLTKVLQHM